MNRLIARVLVCCWLSVGATAWAAADPSYHLFHRRPNDALRELSTDRPDKTESPYSVDVGHAQIEMDLVGYTYDRNTSGGADETTTQWSIGNTNYKIGLSNRIDLQVVVESFTRQRSTDFATGLTESRAGFGDITPRLKINLWGNDDGRTACALMPFLKVPTNQQALGNDDLEGGLIVPLAIELPAGFGMGLMAQLDLARNAADDGHHPEFTNTATISRDLVGPVAGYVELFSQVSAEAGSDWIGTVDVGLTYAIAPNWQLDAGVNLGVTASADNVNPFLGLTMRF